MWGDREIWCCVETGEGSLIQVALGMLLGSIKDTPTSRTTQPVGRPTHFLSLYPFRHSPKNHIAVKNITFQSHFYLFFIIF